MQTFPEKNFCVVFLVKLLFRQFCVETDTILYKYTPCASPRERWSNQSSDPNPSKSTDTRESSLCMNKQLEEADVNRCLWVTLNPKTNQNAKIEAFLTVSAVEQDLNTFSQRVDVFSFPNERIPFFCKKQLLSVIYFKFTGPLRFKPALFHCSAERSEINLLHLLNINLGNECNLLIGLLLTS